MYVTKGENKMLATVTTSTNIVMVWCLGMLAVPSLAVLIVSLFNLKGSSFSSGDRQIMEANYRAELAREAEKAAKKAARKAKIKKLFIGR